MKKTLKTVHIPGFGKCTIRGTFEKGDAEVQLVGYNKWLIVKTKEDIMKACSEVKWFG